MDFSPSGEGRCRQLRLLCREIDECWPTFGTDAKKKPASDSQKNNEEIRAGVENLRR
jgi:hypothetical protein